MWLKGHFQIQLDRGLFGMSLAWLALILAASQQSAWADSLDSDALIREAIQKVPVLTAPAPAPSCRVETAPMSPAEMEKEIARFCEQPFQNTCNDPDWLESGARERQSEAKIQ